VTELIYQEMFDLTNGCRQKKLFTYNPTPKQQASHQHAFGKSGAFVLSSSVVLSINICTKFEL
jgi:hypothetical protein